MLHPVWFIPSFQSAVEAHTSPELDGTNDQPSGGTSWPVIKFTVPPTGAEGRARVLLGSL